jgi:hypothetical protein
MFKNIQGLRANKKNIKYTKKRIQLNNDRKT